MGQLNLAFLGLLFGRSVAEHTDELLDYLDPRARSQMQDLQVLAEAGGDVADLCLTFALTSESLPAYLSRPGRQSPPAESDMKPGGAQTVVDNRSLEEYTRLRSLAVVRSFGEGIGVQLAAAAGGLAVLLPPPLARQVHKAVALTELRLLLGGAGEIDGAAVDEWEANTTYKGGLTAAAPLACWFWEVLRGFGPTDRARVLEFATGSPGVPLGFARLPGGHFSLMLLGDGDGHRLPSASVCFNTLRLPPYRSAAVLRDMLLEAVRGCRGFAEGAVAA